MSEKELCLDKISVERIGRLHPKLRAEALQILAEATAALTGRAMVRITFSLRTMAEQKALYNQGRTNNLPIVTNAKPGQSYHNWGLAVDIAMVIDGKTASWDTQTDWDGDKKSDWMEVVAIFQRHGWEWGGSWQTFKDMPHFEKRTFGGKTYNWRELMTMKVDKDGYVIIPT